MQLNFIQDGDQPILGGGAGRNLERGNALPFLRPHPLNDRFIGSGIRNPSRLSERQSRQAFTVFGSDNQMNFGGCGLHYSLTKKLTVAGAMMSSTRQNAHPGIQWSDVVSR